MKKFRNNYSLKNIISSKKVADKIYKAPSKETAGKHIERKTQQRKQCLRRLGSILWSNQVQLNTKTLVNSVLT